MAGKSGRTISIDKKLTVKDLLLSREGLMVILLIAVIIFCKGISDVYTFQNVLREMPKYLCEIFLLFPMAFLLLMGEIDISVGSIVCLCGTIAVLSSNSGMPFGAVILVTVLTGVACGAFNGLMTVCFRELPTMIITLGTQIIFRGIAELALGDGGSASVTNIDGFKALSTKVGPFPILFFIILLLGALFIFITNKTVFGRSLYAIGSNAKTAHYSGIKVKQVLFISFVTMGVFAALSALFLTGCTYGANTQTGKNFEMDAIAMAVFGGISNMGGKGNLLGGFVAAFIIVCLRVGLGQINLNAQIILIIIGLLLIGAVLIPNISAAISAKKKKAAQS